MSSRYQTSKVTTNYNSCDNKLDELLEDLQSTVKPSRPLTNGTSTGYREVFKSTESQKSGKPKETSKEYEVEYLKPSNSTSIVPERPRSPFFEKETVSSSIPGKNVQSYKTVSYECNTKRSGGTHQTVPSFEHSKHNEKSETKFRHNVNELDSLLDDLNHTQKTEFSSSNNSNQLNRFKGYDPGFMKPLDSSTPKKESHVSRVEERSYEEQRYGSVNSSPIRHTEVKKEVIYNGEPVEKYVDRQYTSNSDVKKDLLFTGGSLRHREPSSPPRSMQEVYHYETKTKSHRAQPPPPLTTSTRNYSYETDVTDNVVPHSSERYVTSSREFNRSPSPVRSVQNYSSLKETKETTTTRRSPSPVRSYYSTTSTTHNVTPQPIRKTMFSATKTVQETTRRETPHSPPPHRSPSPVSFALPPDPPLETTVKSYNFEKNVNRSQSPPPRQKFSPSDPSSDTIPGHTVITRNYKYSSQSHQRSKCPAEDYVPETRPFPTASPSPEIKEQKPPKQLDELMASFSDSESHRELYNTYNSVTRSSSITRNQDKVQTRRPPSPAPTPEKIIAVEKPKLNEIQKTNGVAGPPVYYPPGPLFKKKEEECVIEKSDAGKGKMKAKRKANYKYEAGGKMKDSSDTKKTVVPLCLPVCCALPCVIM